MLHEFYHNQTKGIEVINENTYFKSTRNVSTVHGCPCCGVLPIKLQNFDLLYILTPSPTQGQESGAIVPYIKRS